MNRLFDKRLVIGVGLIVALLIFSAALTHRNTHQLDEDIGSVVHTHEVMELTSGVLLTLVDAETGERGFLITGKDEFLQPYHAALSRLEASLATLREKTQDNPRQQERIKKLKELSAQRVLLLKEAIDVRRKSEKALQEFFAVNQGKEVMDRIRDLIGEMQKEERVLLQDRERRSGRAYRVAVTSGLVTACVGLVLVGALVWLLGNSLSERERAAEILNEQREWLRTTLASIGDAVIATDLKDRVTFLNPVAQALTGWGEEEAKGQPLETVFRIVNEKSRQPVEDPSKRALNEGIIVGLANHTVLISKDGTERPIDDSAAPIRDARGRILGVVLVFRDVTERRRAEQALEEADRRKNEFLATLAHELRNPLAPIRTAVELLRHINGNADLLEKTRGIMDRQLGQITRLVDDLLDISRIARGNVHVQKKRIELAAVVHSAIDAARPHIEASAHQLRVQTPPEPIYLDADMNRLVQVVSNLLNNAARYTEKGGHICVTLERQEGEALLSVRDSGIGIEAEYLPRVFEMFSQGRPDLEGSQGGLGIGLALVRGLVELHGGSVEARSDGIGMGSEFLVRLPIIP